MYLAACKLLEALLTLPSDHLSQFQMFHWSFVSPVNPASSKRADDTFVPLLNRIDELLTYRVIYLYIYTLFYTLHLYDYI